MDTVLVIGEWYSDNLGDGVLCEIVSALLSKYCADKKIIKFDMSLRNDYPENKGIRFDVKKKELVYIRSTVEQILLIKQKKAYDRKIENLFAEYELKLQRVVSQVMPKAIVFAGGQMLMETFITRIEQTIRIAEEHHVHVFFNACGCANKMSRLLKDRLCAALESDYVTMISVRDGYKTLSSIVKKEISDTIDTAILSDDFYFCASAKEKIGYGIMFSRHQSAIQQVVFWRKLLEESKKKGINFQLFCNGSLWDHAFAKYIIKTSNLDESSYLAERPQKPEELVKLITGYKVIISMRLHSLIIAYSSDVPAIAIAWDEKVREFYRKTENSEYCMDLDCSISKLIRSITSIQDEDKLFWKREEIKGAARGNIIAMCTKISTID